MGITKIPDNPGIEPLTWEEDVVSVAGANNTYYDVTDYTGGGKLFQLGLKTAHTDSQDLNLKITSDGNAHEWDLNAVAGTAVQDMFKTNGGNNVLLMDFELGFSSSLKIEMKQDEGGAHALYAIASYGIQSEEWKREVMSAGDPLPGRDYTYPVDVMVVHFCQQVVNGKPVGHQTSKIVFPSIPQVAMSYAPDGTPTGKLKKCEFNTNVKAVRRINWVDDKSSLETEIEIDGEKYSVTIGKGVLHADRLPKKVMPASPIDARKII